jgi:GTP cyclohydrolase III
MVSHSESGKGTAKVIIIKKDRNGVVKSIEHYEGNIFLTYGVEILWYIVVGSITNVTLGICVGNGSTPASASQTCLQGSIQSCSSPGQVSINNNQLSVTATFTDTMANFQWNEIAVAITNYVGQNCGYIPIDRLVTNMGVKQTGETWQVTMTLSIS